MNRLTFTAAFALALLSASCGKKPSAPAAVAPQESPAEAATQPPQHVAPAAAVDSQAPATDEAKLAATLAELTQQARKFGMEQRRPPRDLNELVSAGYISGVPAAPAGKKFAINKNLQVYVGDR